MSRFFFILIFVLLLLPLAGRSQIRWDGEGNDGRWENPLNWSANTIPGVTDDVLLDHSIVPARYEVELPAAGTVAVRSVYIDPGDGDTIELKLPVANTATPSLMTAGAMYGLIIGRKGVFHNLSGASAGIALSIADSIRIDNGGKYVHGSASGHASLVEVLSAATGTEKGILEFDTPNASTTLSFSGRVFGSLALRSARRGGALNYTAAGTRPVHIRGDLQIGEGVNVNLNFTDTIFIHGSLVQEGGVLNLGTTARTVVFAVEGNITQEETALITETGTGAPVLLLNGDAEQRIDLRGGLTEEVAVEKNGAGAAVLLSPLSIGNCLRLKKGRLVTSRDALLVFLPGSRIEADSLGNGGFVQGPVRREGLLQESFLFPVGGNGVMRWLALENATGSFTVEYYRGDPYQLSSVMGEGLDHISRLEYWELNPDDPAAAEALVKLSFHDPNSGGVTDMNVLRGARLQEGIWRDPGATGYAGSAGAAGWVRVGPVADFEAGSNFFALASAARPENPLPLTAIVLRGTLVSEGVELSWEWPVGLSTREFELQASADNLHFFTVNTFPIVRDRYQHRYTHDPGSGLWFYRVLGRSVAGTAPYLSRTIRMLNDGGPSPVIRRAWCSHRILRVKLSSGKAAHIDLMLYNSSGAPVKKYILEVPAGEGIRELPLQILPAGIYYLQERVAGRQMSIHRLINL